LGGTAYARLITYLPDDVGIAPERGNRFVYPFLHNIGRLGPKEVTIVVNSVGIVGTGPRRELLTVVILEAPSIDEVDFDIDTFLLCIGDEGGNAVPIFFIPFGEVVPAAPLDIWVSVIMVDVRAEAEVSPISPRGCQFVHRAGVEKGPAVLIHAVRTADDAA
jgi:hypothetical protein